MGLLDGDLRAEIYDGLADIFLDGVLHVATTTPDGNGGYTTAFVDHSVKVIVDTFSDEYRVRSGIPDTDVRLIILQHGVAAVPTLDSQATVRGMRYALQPPINQDPAQATWELRGRPV